MVNKGDENAQAQTRDADASKDLHEGDARHERSDRGAMHERNEGYDRERDERGERDDTTKIKTVQNVALANATAIQKPSLWTWRMGQVFSFYPSFYFPFSLLFYLHSSRPYRITPLCPT